MNTLEHITKLEPHQYIVIGTNELGLHLGGAAAQAHEDFGALWGVARGCIGGQSYGIVTLDEDMVKMPLSDIDQQAKSLRLTALVNPEKEFLVTRVGCGIACFADREIAPLFKGSPSNVILPKEWEKYR
jgi:hypothetical protein